MNECTVRSCARGTCPSTCMHTWVHTRTDTHTHRQMHLAFIFIVAQARKQLLSFPTWRGPPCHSRSLERERQTDRERGRERFFSPPPSLPSVTHPFCKREVLPGASSRHTVRHSGVPPPAPPRGAVGVGSSPLFSDVSTSSPAQHDGGVLKCLLR